MYRFGERTRGAGPQETSTRKFFREETPTRIPFGALAEADSAAKPNPDDALTLRGEPASALPLQDRLRPSVVGKNGNTRKLAD